MMIKLMRAQKIDQKIWMPILAVVLLITTGMIVGCNTTPGDNTGANAPVEGSNNESTAETAESTEEDLTADEATDVEESLDEELADVEEELDEDSTADESTVEVNPGSGAEQKFDGPINYETRAIWSRIEADHKPLSRKDIDALVAKVDAARLNVILFKVYTKGTAFFEPSHTRFPNSAERLSNQTLFADEKYPNGLSYLLAIRDKRRADDNPYNDFEVHAWFDVILAGDRGKGWPNRDRTEPYMLNALFPEFKMKYGAYYQQEDERFARHDTGVVHQPKFRAYMVDLMAGLVEDYNVDGVHLDRIRTNGICFNDEPLDYPGAEYDYPGCQQDYQTWTQANYGQAYTLWDDTNGHSKIEDEDSGRVAAWQEQGMALMVKSIHDELKAIKPDLIISVASMRNDPSPEVKRLDPSGQVAWEWLDQGWIDVAFVATYVDNTQGVINKIERFRAAVEDESLHSRVFPGLLTYDLDDKEKRVDLLVEQVNATVYGEWTGPQLELPVKGVALFRDKVFSQEAVKALAEKAFTEPALPYWGEDRLISETIQSP